MHTLNFLLTSIVFHNKICVFNHNFNDCINPWCTCSLDIESIIHYFLHCNYYNNARISLLNDLNSVDRTLLNLSDLSLVNVNVLLYGGRQFNDSQNTFILNSSIKYILISERFSGRLFYMKIEENILLFSFAVIIILYPFHDFIHFQISFDLLSSN